MSNLKITRNSAGLREALFREWEGVLDGSVPLARAQTSANLARQIINSVRLEIAHKIAQAGQMSPLALGED